MDWEQRSRSNGKYLCRSVRINGRVSKQYVGRSADPVVQLIAKTDALSKAESAAAIDQFAQLEPTLAAIAARVESAFTARATEGEAMQGKPERQPQSRSNAEQPTRELLEHLVRQANRDDGSAANQLRRMLRRHPRIWQDIGDLGQHVEQCLINLIAAGNLLLRESLILKAGELRASLSGR